MLKESNNKTYLYVIDGKISKKVSEGQGTMRKNKNGVEVWEQQYRSIVGNLISFAIEESKVGEQLSIEMQDADESYTLQLPVESGYFSSFCEKIENVDKSLPVEIRTYSFIPEGKTKKFLGLNFYQNGDKVEKFITRENKPEGYPEPEGDTSSYSKDDWKVYFMKKTIWEKGYIKRLTTEVSPEKVAASLKGVGEVDFDASDIDPSTPF